MSEFNDQQFNSPQSGGKVPKRWTLSTLFFLTTLIAVVTSGYSRGEISGVWNALFSFWVHCVRPVLCCLRCHLAIGRQILSACRWCCHACTRYVGLCDVPVLVTQVQTLESLSQIRAATFRSSPTSNRLRQSDSNQQRRNLGGSVAVKY